MEKKPSTFIAKELARNLFFSAKDFPTYVCTETGMVIEPSSEFMDAHNMNDAAMGAHYEAFGFYYILCFDMEYYEEYVAIHDSEGKIVGTMTTVDEVQVGVWRS